MVYINALPMSNDLADIDHIHLATIATVWRIDDHLSAIWAEPWCSVAAPEPGIFRRGVEVAQRKELSGLRVVQIRMLLSFIIWRGIADDPSVAWQVTGVTIASYHVRRNDLGFTRVCVKQIKPGAVRRLVAPDQ